MKWKYSPQIVQWDITSACNLECRHCRAANLERGVEDISFKQVTSILKQIYVLAPNVSLAVAGGEPLGRKDLRNIFSFVRENLEGINIELLSNGTLIDEKNVGWPFAPRAILRNIRLT